MKRWSLRVRFLSVLVILMVGVFVAITLLIVQKDRTTLRDNLITQSKSFAALATQPIGNAYVIYKDSGSIKIKQEVSSFTDLDQNINKVEIIDANGNQLFNTDASSSIKVSVDAAAGLSPTYLQDNNGKLYAIIQPYSETYGIHRYDVVFGITYQSVDQSINDIISSIITLSASILLLTLMVCYILINRIFLRPVAEVSREALLISQGDLDRQIHLDRHDEIGDLAAAVDTMASSLKADIAKLKQIDQLKSEFLMITAHSLRTPLTIIEGYIDNLKAAKSHDNLQNNLDSISTNVKRLGHFAEDALTISTVEEGQTNLELKPTEMAPVITGISNEFAALAKQKNIEFTSNIDTAASVKLNNPYFHSALWNILDNAYKFTHEGGIIELNAVDIDNKLEVIVKDNGIGIAANEITQLFTKFHRATDTLVYDYEGMGIGLYLTKLIVEQHNGTVEVESTEGKGSTFTFYLPIVNKSEN